jgi:hypothetical protein
LNIEPVRSPKGKTASKIATLEAYIRDAMGVVSVL